MPDNPTTTIRAGEGEGIYLFCLARPHLAETLDLSGPDDGQAVSQCTFQGIRAVIGKVSLGEFCGPEAESRLKDLAWIGPRAYRHEEVVRQVMHHSPVLPARFGTIFTSLDGLENLIKIHAITILQFLDHVAGKEEWSVKGLVDSEKAKKRVYSTTMAAEAENLASLPPGARYFREKRIQSEIGNRLNLICKKKTGGDCR